MSLSLGQLSIILQLDNSQFRAGVSSAHRDLQGLSGAAQRGIDAVNRGTTGALSAVGKVAGDVVKAAGVAFTAVAGTVTGLVVAAGKAGVAYNGMQQASRAALTTMLGGAEEANRQMDKLDEFARSSPFAKQVFIKAQQQLIGFGVAADNVLPTLDAIQNTVAAIGGSNTEIAAITEIIAKIRSGASLGLMELNQFGNYGINAAKLIGEQMGMTEQQFRDSIFGNPLKGADALKGLDALIAGMQKNFDGAASGVKATWVGAVDRIKGAWRDIGSDLAEPFVNHTGGGMAIVWVNQVADLMRALQKQIGPVMDVLVGRLMPAFDRIGPALVRARAAVTGFDVSGLNAQLDKLAKYAPLIAGAAGALTALGGNAFLLSRLGISLNPVVAGVVALVAASPELRGVLRDFLTSLSPLLPVVQQLGKQVADTLVRAIRDLSPVLTQVLNALAPVIVAFASGLPPVVGVAANAIHALTPVLKVAATAFEGLAHALEFVAPILPTVLTGLLAYKAVGVVMGGLTTGLARMSQGLATATYSMSGPLAGAAGAASNGLSKVSAAVSKVGGALPLVGFAVVAITSAMEAADQQTEKWARALLEGGKAAETARRQMGDLKSAMRDTDPDFFSNLLGAGLTAKAATAGQAMKDAQKRADELKAAMNPLERAQQDVTKATNDLAQAQQDYGYGSAQAQGAAVALTDAQARQTKVERDLAEAKKTTTQRMAEQAQQALAQANAQLAYEQATVSAEKAQKDYNDALATGDADKRAEAERNLRQQVLNAAQAAAEKAKQDNAARSEAEQNEAAVRAQIDVLNEFIAKAGKDAPQALIDYRNQLTKAAADSDTVKRAVDGVTGAITAMPGGKTVVIKAPTDDAMAALKALGVKVETLPDGRVKVTAETEAAQTAIDRLINANSYRQLPINVNVGGAGRILARAGGGPVWPGQPFLVGEHGPELVRFSGRGEVIPADRTAQIMAGNRQAAPAATAVMDRPQRQAPVLQIDNYYEQPGSSPAANAEALAWLARTRS